MDVHDIINWAVDVVEVLGASMILAGVFIALFRIAKAPFLRPIPQLAPVQIRLGLGMFLALGLEFLLAADILRTAVSPTFHDLGILAAIATIRTALNFFLGREIVEGQHQIEVLQSAHLNGHAVGPPALPVHDEKTPSPPAGRRSTLRSALAGPLFTTEGRKPRVD